MIWNVPGVAMKSNMIGFIVLIVGIIYLANKKLEHMMRKNNDS